MNLLETYSRKLKIAEAYNAKVNKGTNLTQNQKIAIATLLNNTNRILTESLSSAAATQFSDMGAYRKFCLSIATLLPVKSIAKDLVIIHPMTSVSGYVTYLQYSAGYDKGDTKQGDIFANPFQVDVTTNYSSAAVVETITADTAGTFTTAWNPVMIIDAGLAAKYGLDDTAIGQPFIMKQAAGTTTWELAAATEVDGAYEVAGVADGDKIKYLYDNVIIPQEKLPAIKAEIKAIPLVAKFRRVAVYWSQIAAFEASTDYGIDLPTQLAEQAVNQLTYEIDNEIVNFLADGAEAYAGMNFDVVSDGNFTYVSRSERYEGFVEAIERGKQYLYSKTGRFMANFLLVASDVAVIMPFLKGWVPADVKDVNGPYVAGMLGSLKVVVSPAIPAGTYVLGVNGSDMMSAAAVYAPYMPIVPTQVVEFASGANQQGFSTGYALEMLNKNLLAKGTITWA